MQRHPLPASPFKGEVIIRKISIIYEGGSLLLN